MKKEVEEEKVKEVQKIENYRSACKAQLEENRRLKEDFKKKEDEEEKMAPKGHDLLG